MPGSTLTSNLISPYTSAWSVDGAAVTYSENVFTVGTHPLSTGDAVFVYSSGTAKGKFFTIKVSDTQISIASTYANAIANVPLSLTTTLLGSVGQIGIGNYLGMGFNGLITYYVQSVLFKQINWNATSISATAFSLSRSVQINFETPVLDFSVIGRGVPFCIGLKNLDESYICSFLLSSFFNSVAKGDSISGFSQNQNVELINNQRIKGRITISGSRVFVAIANSSNVYTTIFTSSVLSPGVGNLYLFANFGLNGLSFINCQITYL